MPTEINVKDYGAQCDTVRLPAGGTTVKDSAVVTLNTPGSVPAGAVGLSVQLDRVGPGALIPHWCKIVDIISSTSCEVDRAPPEPAVNADGRFHTTSIRTGTISIDARSVVLTDTASDFKIEDIGKSYYVEGCGRPPLYTTISQVSSTTITLADAASDRIDDADIVFGTDDTDALKQALAAQESTGLPIIIPGYIKVATPTGPTDGSTAGAIFPLNKPDHIYDIRGLGQYTSGIVYRSFGDKDPMFDWPIYQSEAWIQPLFALNEGADGTNVPSRASLLLSGLEIDMGFRVAMTGSGAQTADPITNNGWGKGQAVRQRGGNSQMELRGLYIHNARAEVVFGAGNSNNVTVRNVLIDQTVANAFNFGASVVDMENCWAVDCDSSGFAVSAENGGTVENCGAIDVQDNWIQDNEDVYNSHKQPLIVDNFTCIRATSQGLNFACLYGQLVNSTFIDCNDANGKGAIEVRPPHVVGHGSYSLAGLDVNGNIVLADNSNVGNGLMISDNGGNSVAFNVTVQNNTFGKAKSDSVGVVAFAFNIEIDNPLTDKILITNNITYTTFMSRLQTATRIPAMRGNWGAVNDIEIAAAVDTVLASDQIRIGAPTGGGTVTLQTDVSLYMTGHLIVLKHWPGKDPVLVPQSSGGFLCQVDRTIDGESELELEFTGSVFKEVAWRQF